MQISYPEDVFADGQAAKSANCNGSPSCLTGDVVLGDLGGLVAVGTVLDDVVEVWSVNVSVFAAVVFVAAVDPVLAFDVFVVVEDEVLIVVIIVLFAELVVLVLASPSDKPRHAAKASRNKRTYLP